jgi:Lon protease-like protein
VNRKRLLELARDELDYARTRIVFLELSDGDRDTLAAMEDTLRDAINALRQACIRCGALREDLEKSNR